MSDTIKALAHAVYEGEEADALKLTQQAIDEKIPVQEILDQGLVQGLRECGASFEKMEKFIPEMLMSADTMKSAMVLLKPLMADGDGGISTIGHTVLATVEGDVHDIGLDLLRTMFETAGFSVTFMGPDVPTDDIVATVKEEKPHILGLSALLSNTMDIMPGILARLDEEGLRGGTKVMIGGAPVKQDFCDMIGADGWAFDASSAVPVAKKLRAELG